MNVYHVFDSRLLSQLFNFCIPSHAVHYITTLSDLYNLFDENVLHLKPSTCCLVSLPTDSFLKYYLLPGNRCITDSQHFTILGIFPKAQITAVIKPLERKKNDEKAHLDAFVINTNI